MLPFPNQQDLRVQAILVNDVAISPSEETKFLGIIVDDKLSFSSHVDHIISKRNSPCTKRGPICSQHKIICYKYYRGKLAGQNYDNIMKKRV